MRSDGATACVESNASSAANAYFMIARAIGLTEQRFQLLTVWRRAGTYVWLSDAMSITKR
jgi:hypothetical protein